MTDTRASPGVPDDVPTQQVEVLVVVRATVKRTVRVRSVRCSQSVETAVFRDRREVTRTSSTVEQKSRSFLHREKLCQEQSALCRFVGGIVGCTAICHVRHLLRPRP